MAQHRTVPDKIVRTFHKFRHKYLNLKSDGTKYDFVPSLSFMDY
jgi:hypothetical protein